MALVAAEDLTCSETRRLGGLREFDWRSGYPLRAIQGIRCEPHPRSLVAAHGVGIIRRC